MGLSIFLSINTSFYISYYSLSLYRKELERMLAEGYSIQDILNHFMKNGKTAEQEQNEINQRMQVRVTVTVIISEDLRKII